MPARSLTERVAILEQKMDALQMLPDRITSLESQTLQLRGEMRDEFSAIRERDEEARRHMHVLHEDVISRFALLQEGLLRLAACSSTD